MLVSNIHIAKCRVCGSERNGDDMEVKDVLNNPHAVISILGMRGCGKTYLSCHLNFPSDCTVIYIDVVGVFVGFMGLNPLQCDKLPTQETFNKIMIKALDDNQTKTERKLILDISELSREDMVTVVNWLSDFLFYQRKKGKYAVVADEVGEFMEQEHGYYSQGFERLVRMGRNKGIAYMILITQRPQKVNKHILTLSEHYVVFKFIHNLDIAAVREILGKSEREFSDMAIQLKGLGVGEYMLTDGLSEYWNMRKREKVITDVETGQKTITEFTPKEPDKCIETDKQNEEINTDTEVKPVVPVPENRGVWTIEEENKIILLRKNKVSFSKIAFQLNRPYYAVRERWRKLQSRGRVKG